MKKLSNKFIVFTVFVLIFSLIGCTSNQNPSEVLNNYYENMKDDNPEMAYSILCEKSKKNFLKEDFVKWQKITRETLQLKDVKIEKLNEYKDKNVDGTKFKDAIEFNITETNKDFYMNKEIKRHCKIYVVNESGKWKVYRCKNGKELEGKKLVGSFLNYLAIIYMEGRGNKPKDLNKAAIILNESLKYDEHTNAYYDLARTYYKLKKYDEGIEVANKCIEKANDNNQKSDGYTTLGMIYEAKHNLNKSIECYTKAIHFSNGNICAEEHLRSLKKH